MTSNDEARLKAIKLATAATGVLSMGAAAGVPLGNVGLLAGAAIGGIIGYKFGRLPAEEKRKAIRA